MLKDVQMTFYNQGLRSYIEVDLCSQCPRIDNKGCCGQYSPVFYPLDLAYMMLSQADLIEYIFKLDDITLLDTSITVNNDIDGESYKCKFHSQEKGCALSQNLRESICRHFVCPGIYWQKHKELETWHNFFIQLEAYENQMNEMIASKLQEKNLSLRYPSMHKEFLNETLALYQEIINNPPEFIKKQTKQENHTIKCSISYGEDWPL